MAGPPLPERVEVVFSPRNLKKSQAKKSGLAQKCIKDRETLQICFLVLCKVQRSHFRIPGEMESAGNPGPLAV